MIDRPCAFELLVQLRYRGCILRPQHLQPQAVPPIATSAHHSLFRPHQQYRAVRLRPRLTRRRKALLTSHCGHNEGGLDRE